MRKKSKKNYLYINWRHSEFPQLRIVYDEVLFSSFISYIFVRTSLLCKVKFTLLQSKFFPAKFFFCFFGKGKFGGKKFTWQKSESTLQRRFFLFVNFPFYIIIQSFNVNQKYGKLNQSSIFIKWLDSDFDLFGNIWMKWIVIRKIGFNLFNQMIYWEYLNQTCWYLIEIWNTIYKYFSVLLEIIVGKHNYRCLFDFWTDYLVIIKIRLSKRASI